MEHGAPANNWRKSLSDALALLWPVVNHHVVVLRIEFDETAYDFVKTESWFYFKLTVMC